MSAFARDTAITPAAVPGVYDADLVPSWAIGGKPNGGYLLAILGRAACAAVGTDSPLAISAHYMRAPDLGAAEVRTEVVRQGRRVSTSRATIWQNDKPCIDALVSSGTIENAEIDYSAAPPPVIPPPEQCIGPATEKFTVELYENVEMLMSPDTVPLPNPNGTPTLQFWLRFADGTEPDPMALLVAVDAHPPTIFHLKKYGWAPTVELTVILRGRPSPGWLLVEATTELLSGGWFDETARVWDSTGRLVAQARQLALAGLPPKKD